MNLGIPPSCTQSSSLLAHNPVLEIFFSHTLDLKALIDVQAKVENAQAAGYSGVIVFNYLDDDLIPMGKFYL